MSEILIRVDSTPSGPSVLGAALAVGLSGFGSSTGIGIAVGATAFSPRPRYLREDSDLCAMPYPGIYGFLVPS